MDIFSALADPTRRTIIEILAGSDQLSASEICDNFSVSAPAISQHLKVLREANLVTVEKRAQQRMYTINKAKIDEFDGWVQRMKKLWDERFDALDTLLEREKRKLSKAKNNRYL